MPPVLDVAGKARRAGHVGAGDLRRGRASRPGCCGIISTASTRLIATTYRWTGDRVQSALAKAVAGAPQTPRKQLLAYLTASFAPPIADPELLATWLAFWALTKTDSQIARLHGEIYRDYRAELETLLAAFSPGDHRLAAVALAALVDGLWLELSLGNAPFSREEAGALVEKWLDALLG